MSPGKTSKSFLTPKERNFPKSRDKDNVKACSKSQKGLQTTIQQKKNIHSTSANVKSLHQQGCYHNPQHPQMLSSNNAVCISAASQNFYYTSLLLYTLPPSFPLKLRTDKRENNGNFVKSINVIKYCESNSIF